MNILIVCPAPPYPLHNGGYIRIFKLAEGLSMHHEVDLLCMDLYGDAEEQRPELSRVFRHITFARQDRVSKGAQAMRILGKLVRGIPFYNKYTDSKDLDAKLAQLVREHRYDVVEFVHTYMAGHLDALPPGLETHTALSMQNISTSQFERMVRHEPHPINKLKLMLTLYPMRRWEPKMAKRFDSVITCSREDKILLEKGHSGLDAHIIPNGVDTTTFNPLPREGREPAILMMGSLDYAPNVDAVRFFYNEIFPLVLKQQPSSRLLIVGRNPPDAILALDADAHVEVHGNVPDVRPFYERAMVSVVALRSGGGTRLKILEAMATGTPVVSTRIGCEGIQAADTQEILLADDPVLFSSQVAKVLTDGPTWKSLSSGGRALVERSYDWKTLSSQLDKVYTELHSKGHASQ